MATPAPRTEDIVDGEGLRAADVYDAFLSFSHTSDYQNGRRVEAFLESIHKISRSPAAGLRALKICRDGSDFTLPRGLEYAAPTSHDPIWRIILQHLSGARFLLVLCSPGAVTSPWVRREIAWFIAHRGADSVLPIVTQGSDPATEPSACFPPEILEAGIHLNCIWYDLRGLRRPEIGARRIKDPEDELVRIAGDLLSWDSAAHGQLLALWQRERLKAERRRASVVVAIASMVVLLAGIATWQAVRARQEAVQTKIASLLNIARSSPDPTTATLVLLEAATLSGGSEPADGTSLALDLTARARAAAVLIGHQRGVVRVQFDPSGTRLLTASADGTARIWDLARSHAPLVLAAASAGALADARFSDDGRLVAGAGVHGEAVLWRSDGVGSPTVFRGHADPVRSVRFSLDGRRLVTASDDGTARVWDIAHPERSLVFSDHRGPVASAVFDRAGERVLTASADGTSRLWRIDVGGESQVFGFPGLVQLTSARFSPDERMILLGSSDATAWLWSPTMAFPMMTLTGNGGPVATSDFSPNGEFIVTGSTDGSVKIWSVGSLAWTGGNASRSNFDAGSAVSKAFFSPDGRRVAAVSADGATHVWPTDGSEGVRVFYGHEGPVLDAAFSPDSRWLATASGDATVRIWDVDAHIGPEMLTLHAGPPRAVQGDAHADHLLTRTSDGTTWLWSRKGDSYVMQYHDHNPAIAAAIDTTGKWLLTVARDGEATVVDTDAPTRRRLLTHLDADVRQVAIDGHGTTMAAVSADGTARVWLAGATAARVLQQTTGQAPHVRFSPDGNLVVAALADRTVRVWRTDGTGDAIVFRGHEGAVTDAVFSDDSRYLASVSVDGTARVWDTTSREATRTFRGHSGPVLCAAFGTSGRRVVTGAEDGVRLWRLDESDQPVHVSAGHPVHLAALDRESSAVVAAFDDGQAAIWHVDWLGLVGRLRRTTSACLGTAARMRLLGEPAAKAEERFAECERMLAPVVSTSGAVTP